MYRMMRFSSQHSLRTATCRKVSICPRDTRLMLSARLVDLGFSSAARDVLGQDGRLYDQGRLLLAKAALAERDAPAALAYLSVQSGEEASRIRGEGP